MRPLLSLALVVSFIFTSVFAELPAQASAYQYSAYRRPGDRAWNRAWTRDLLTAITAQKRRLEAARDLETWCPGYHSATSEQQNECFVRLFTGISAWESSNNPRELGDGGRSVGLMQIGAFNCRRERFGAGALMTPRANTACGVRLAADLIARDGVISSEGPVRGRWGTTRVRRLGLGRGGWSVMMANQTVRWHGRAVQVGRLQQIGNGMRSYRDPRYGTVAVLDKRNLLA